MQYRSLGRTGIKVSPYALGAMMFGAGGNPYHEDSARIIHKALDAGINFVDTADVYSRGESEEIVGKALIDLYQVHRPDPDTDIEETLSALSDLIHAGKVRAIGSSAMPPSDIVEAQWVAERRGLERFRTEQPTYSILNRGIEREVLPVAQRYGIGTLVWSPLAKGMLTGRIRKGQQTDLRRAAMLTSFSDEAPGTDVGAPDQSAYLPPALQRPDPRRRPVGERAAA